MLIAKSVDCTLRVLKELAKEPSKMCSASALSQNLALPEPLVRRILRDLTKAGILSSSIGREGGYMLAKPLEKVSLRDVLQALGPEAFTFGIIGQGRVKFIPLDPSSPTFPFWRTLEKKFWSLTKSQTLADLV